MAKMTGYGRRKVSECTGEWLKGCVMELLAHEKEGGCCHLCFDVDAKDDYCVCVGWTLTDEPKRGDYQVAWKIGRQSRYNISQCDFDIDFEMPYNPEAGDVDDTRHVLAPLPKTKLDWEREAALARKNARRVWREWAEEDEDEE